MSQTSIVTIDFSQNCPLIDTTYGGEIGECDAVTLKVIPEPVMLENSNITSLHMLFATPSGLQASATFTKTQEISIDLWLSLTQSEVLECQLVATNNNGSVTIKSPIARLYLDESLTGSIVGIDDQHDSIIAQLGGFNTRLTTVEAQYIKFIDIMDTTTLGKSKYTPVELRDMAVSSKVAYYYGGMFLGTGGYEGDDSTYTFVRSEKGELNLTKYVVNANKTMSINTYTVVPTTRTINGKALSSNITLTASDIPGATGKFYKALCTQSSSGTYEFVLQNSVTKNDIRNAIKGGSVVYVKFYESGSEDEPIATILAQLMNNDEVVFTESPYYEDDGYLFGISGVMTNSTAGFLQYNGWASYTTFNAHTEDTDIHTDATEKATWNAKQDAMTEGTDYLSPSNVDNHIDNKLTSYATKNELNAHSGNTEVHTTSSEKSTWNGKYTKPASGIPSTDMTEAVQTSLGKADTALQEHQSLSAYRTSAQQDDIDATKVDKVSGKGLSTNDYTNADKSKVGEIDNKADYDGYYESLSVGLSDNLIDRKGNGTAQEIVYRTSCGTDSVADDGNGIIQKIKGNTVVWNQLINKDNYEATVTRLGVTFTKNADGSITASGTATANSNYKIAIQNSIPIVGGHKYLIFGFDLPTGVRVVVGGASSGLTYREFRTPTVFTAESGATNIGYCFFQIGNGTTVDNIKIYPMLVDLTTLADSTITDYATFKAKYSLPYYAYNVGTLLNYNGTGLKTVGFNQLNPTDGKIKVIASQTYRIEGSYTSITDSEGNSVTVSNSQFTPSKNDTYTVVATTMPCIHLVWSGYRNGETEKHWTKTLPLPISTYFPSGMKSVGATYDEINPNKAITRIGTRAYQSGDENDSTVVTDKTNTYYVLEEPTEVDVSLNLTYSVSDFGTEESLPQNTSTPTTTPLKAIVKYSDDYTRSVANLSKNYDTVGGLDGLASSLASTLSSALNGTFAITRGAYDSSTKKYAWSCSFTPNEP